MSCTATPGATDPVAVVAVHGQSSYVLRDYADEDHPKTVCTFGLGTVVDQIINPHLLTMLVDGLPAVVEIPSGTIHQLSIAPSQYAVAPDISSVLWFSVDATSLHQSWDGNDAVLQQYPTTAGRCGAPDIDSKDIAFSRDGGVGFALWQQNFADTTYLNVIRNHQSVFALAPPTTGWKSPGGPLMAVWSPAAQVLFFTELGDVWTWSPAVGPSNLTHGLRWIDPSISPDGKHLVYMSRDSSGIPTVHFLNPASGAIGAQVGGAGRDTPFFLTNDLIWMHADLAGCVGGQPTSYVYDLRTNSESPSILDAVSRTWPASSALGG